MSKEDIISYYRDRDLMDDVTFIGGLIDEEFIQDVLSHVSYIPYLMTNIGSLDRRKVHLICEALGLYHQRTIWRDELKHDENLQSYDHECGCKYCKKELYASCTRTGITISKTPIPDTSRKAIHHMKERELDRRKQV